jgi:spore coat protein CotH
MILVLFFVCLIYAQESDSSSIIFDDSKVHYYELQFYYSSWQDSLLYYKNLPDEDYIPARMIYRISETDSIVLDSVGVRYKGNSSYVFAAKSPKKPFKFSFDKYRDGRRFFGVKKLNFSNAAKDPSMLREKISYDILGKLMPSPRACFAVISIEGEMIGLYTQIEQVDKTFLKRYFSNNDGNLYKSSDNGSTLLFRSENQSDYEAEYELKTNEKENDWSRFVGMIKNLNSDENAETVVPLGSYLDTDIICRYLAFNMVFSNFDSYTGSGRNFYLYDDLSKSRFTLIPWDLNLSFGAYSNNWNVKTTDIITISNLKQRPLSRRIIEDDSLREVYLGYIRLISEEMLCSDSVAKLTEKYSLLIDSLVKEDKNKLHSYDEFQKNIDSDVTIIDNMSRVTIPGLTSFCTQRCAALQTQLESCTPVINPSSKHKPESISQFHFQVCSSNKIRFRYILNTLVRDFRIEVVNMAGKIVFSESASGKPAGIYDSQWSAASSGQGVFAVRILSGRKLLQTGKFIVLKQ